LLCKYHSIIFSQIILIIILYYVCLKISSDEKNFKKPQKKQKLRGNKKFDNYTDDSNLSGSSPEVRTNLKFHLKTK